MPGVTDLAFIAAGGAVGALGRYAVLSSGAAMAGGFPYGTLAVNVIGALLMGLLIEGIALGADIPVGLRLGLVVGVLGAFTTFSAFSLDTYLLYKDGRLVAAALYVGASTLLSIGAIFVGVALARAMARLAG